MRIGLLAAARITPSAVVEPAARIAGVEVVGVAARTLDRARAATEEWGLDRAFGSYQELVDSPDVDAIYIATPAALHHRWTLAALAAGKPVLVEKPFAANAVEAREMVAAADATGRRATNRSPTWSSSTSATGPPVCDRGLRSSEWSGCRAEAEHPLAHQVDEVVVVEALPHGVAGVAQRALEALERLAAAFDMGVVR